MAASRSGEHPGNRAVPRLPEALSRSVGPLLDGRPLKRRKPRDCGAFVQCAEEDSNLHPVIPDRALKFVCAIVARSISHSRAKDRRALATVETYESTWSFSGLCAAPRPRDSGTRWDRTGVPPVGP